MLHRGGNLRNNRLRLVQDAVAEGNYDVDIDDRLGILANAADSNYVYDAIGNLTVDKKEGIDNIEWTVYGKIARIEKTDGTVIVYTYDASGNRISKQVARTGLPTGTTWYVRDASGNVMAVYAHSGDGPGLLLEEQHLYGSSRLGMRRPGLDVADPTLEGSPANLLGSTNLFTFDRGRKFFELTNHLGNSLPRQRRGARYHQRP